MKWLILLGLMVIIAAVIAARYRQQIKMAIYVWRMFRKMRQAGAAEEKQIDKQANLKDAALVRCAKCGIWIPQNKSLRLGSGSRYCSTVCLEKTAQIN